MTEASAEPAIRPLRPTDWPLVETLFGPNGACGGCWCMHWRVEKGGRTWEAMQGEPARRAFRDLVEGGEVHAVLALAGGRPVGWCCFGPRRQFPRLLRARSLQRERATEPWAVVCFFIARRWRAAGLGTRLLHAATEAAFAAGAPEVEGYPVNVRPGVTMPAAFAWTGVPAIFAAAGYRPVPARNSARSIYVRERTA